MITGFLCDRIGRKKTMIIAGIMFFISGLGCAFAPSMTLLIISRMIGGIGVGMASVVSPMYITEFSPAEKRGRMVAYYQLAITIGILLAYFSNALIVSVIHNNQETSQWFFVKEIWRPMFFAMTLPSVAFIIMLIKIPESPRWLVAAKRNEEAKVVLNTIRTPEAAAKELREITDASLKDNLVKISLFSKELRLPFILGVVLAILQLFCGINAIIYYGPKIF
jgi:SP family arabinose:H+ symporter-like MFS transporter